LTIMRRLILTIATTLIMGSAAFGAPASAQSVATPSGCITEGGSEQLAVCPSDAPTINSAAVSGGGGLTSNLNAAATPTGSVYQAGGQVTGLNGLHLNAPIVGVSPTTEYGSYYLVASDGGVFAFKTQYFGSMGGKSLNAPIVGMAQGFGGYWLVASDGGVFAFGNVPFYGSMGGKPLNSPIVGITSTVDFGGYYLVAADGGVFAFGDAKFYGSSGGNHLNAPIVGMASTDDGGGYWLASSDGGIFAYGDAPFYGSFLGLGSPLLAIGFIYPLGLPPTRQQGAEGYCVAFANGQTYCSN
jgi:hypothetical protein